MFTAAAVIFGAVLGLWWLETRARPPLEPPPDVPEPAPRTLLDHPIPLAPPGIPMVGVAAFERGVAGRLAAEPPPVEPLVGRLRFELYDVRLDDPDGRRVLTADAVIAAVDPGALLAGDVEAGPVLVRRPDVLLERRAPGQPWNVERVLARAVDPDDDGPARVRLTDVTVVDGRLEVRTPADTVVAAGIQATVPVALLADPVAASPNIAIASLIAALTLPDVPRALEVIAADGRFLIVDDALAFRLARLDFDRTRIRDASGTWRFDAPGLGLAATARVDRLVFADIAFLVPDLPPEGEAAFGLRLEPRPAARTAVHVDGLVAAVPPSEVRGSLSLVLFGPEDPFLEAADLLLDPLAIDLLERFTGPIPYDGLVRGRVVAAAGTIDFDVVATLTTDEVPDPFDVAFTGRVLWTVAVGVRLEHVVATFEDLPLLAVRPIVDLPLRGVATGRVELRGPPDEAPIELDVRLVLAEGVFDVAGTVDLRGVEPAYDLAGDIRGVRVAEVLEPDVPPVILDARFTLVGVGTDPRLARARILLDGTFTGWESEPGDGILANAALSAGTLVLDTLDLRLATLALGAAGTWRFVPPASGAIAYDLDVADLEPFGPYLPGLPPARVEGALRTAGTLTGTLERPLFRGFADGEGIRYADWTAARVQAVYAVRLGAPQPHIDLHAVAADVESPVEDFHSATLRIRTTPPTFAVDFRGDRVEDGLVHVVADGRFVDGAGQAWVRQFDIFLDDRPWSLAEPAFVRWTPDGVFVQRFDLREVDDAGRLLVSGRIAPVTAADFRVELVAFPLDPVARMAAPRFALEGRAWAVIDVAGPADLPTIDADVVIRDGAVDGLEFVELRADLRYRDMRLTADAAAVLAPEAVVDIDASLPVAVTLALPPQVEWIEAAPVTALVSADRVPARALQGLFPDLRDLEGVVTAEATVAGTPATPVLDGFLRVTDGEATVVALNQRYTDIALDVRFQGRTAVIDTARARSDGWGQASGFIVFEPLTRPELDVLLTFDEFRAVGVEGRRDPALSGEVRVTGPLVNAVMSGALVLDDGTFPITEFVPGVPAGTPEPAPIAGEPIQPLLPPGLVIEDLTVEVGPTLWLATEEIRAQLSGVLTIARGPDEPLTIVGTLSGTRGTFNLRVGPILRRFTIQEAEVRFLGASPPDPQIEITATRFVPGPQDRELELVIVIGGTAQQPTFALGTPDAVPLPEEELLSILLFGQPGLLLGEGILPGEQILETALLLGLADLLAVEFEQFLAAELGFPVEVFRFQPGAPGAIPLLGAPTLVFGTEVSADVFLTVDTGLGVLFGPAEAGTNPWAVRLEWRIDPEWRLRIGYEPVTWGRLFRGITGALPVTRVEQQLMVEIRRRWTY